LTFHFHTTKHDAEQHKLCLFALHFSQTALSP